MNRNILVTYEPGAEEKGIYREMLEGIANVYCLAAATDIERPELLNSADVIISLSFSKKEIDPTEISRLKNVRFIQLIYAGADNIPFSLVPEDILLASNAGAFAEPIAEHVMALTRALARGLNRAVTAQNEGAWRRSEIGNSAPLTKLRGKTLLVVGLGGIGTEVARLADAAGMRVTAIRNSRRSGPPFVASVGLTGDLPTYVGEADVVVN